MAKEIRGLTKEQLSLIADCLRVTFEFQEIKDELRPEVDRIVKRIDKQLKEWNGVKDDKEK